MIKKSYPNYSDYQPQAAVFDIQKWTNALRDIYIKVRLGLNKTAATEEITREWPALEKYNFSNWMRYYESGDMNKYKTAQDSYYSNEETGYFLPNPKNRPNIPSPIKSMNDIEQEAAKSAEKEINKAEQAARNEEVRKSLISRLNSLEKILLKEQGFTFAGKEFENLLKSVQNLKIQISTHGRVVLSAQTCIDLLIREAGILSRKNCLVGSNLMMKLAQQTPGNTGNLDSGAIPAGGAIEGGGSGAQGTPMPNLNNPPASLEEEAPKSGIEGFLANLDGGAITNVDELEADDSNQDEVIMDEDSVEVDAFTDFDNDLVVVAQEVVERRPQRQPQPEEGVLKEKLAPKSDFDTLVNSVFGKVTIEDLLGKLQDIAVIFKKKEINKQLAIVELMFSALDLTPFFTQFSEIEQKQLDAGNYSLTRINDIISTLQGSLGKSTIDLAKPESVNDPEAQLLKRHLENEEAKDKERKEMRKEINQQKLLEDKPELTVESPAEELAKPVVEKPQRPKVVAPGV